MKKKLLILCSGSGTNAKAIIESLKGTDIEVTIGCNVNDAGVWELLKGEEIVDLSSPNDEFAVLEEFLKNNEFDLIALAGYMRILPPHIVALIAGKAINIHPSLLPKYKGSKDAYANAFNAGDKIIGCTVHVVTDEVDGGDILTRVEFELPDKVTTLEEMKKLGLKFEHRLYPTTIRRIMLGEDSPINLFDDIEDFLGCYSMESFIPSNGEFLSLSGIAKIQF